MSKKQSRPESEQSAKAWEMFRALERSRNIDTVIEKVTGWPARCPGPCFPLVGRWWDG
jgi:hypothetical protein